LKLQEKFVQLEKDRLTLLNEIKILNDDELNYKPKPDKWSIIQVIHHLIKSEQLSVVYIKRKISNKSNIDKSNLRSKFNAFALKWGLNFPIKFKAPASVSNVPDFDTFENTTSKWDNVRNSFIDLINNTSERILYRNIFKHPIAGKMNIIGTLDFFDAHFQHHKKQIKSLLTHLTQEKK